ncbi:MAG TPA: ABC transporter permease subunit [Fimbriimonadaceae bacterium]|nr:ABC transporter permease subunit [Fimbriimonadaceae bacterium]
MANPAAPIADLSYRTYDGPLAPPTFRWWSIAKMTMRLNIKKKLFWWWALLTPAWYYVLGSVFYFADLMAENARTMGTGADRAVQTFLTQIVWKDQFLDAFNRAQIWLFLITVTIGAGIIAADNRANALLVYLSKPCTKLDYIAGKWVGMFLMMTAVMGVPTLLFYAYCLLSYRSYGFLSQDPWLILKLLAMIPLPAALYASIILGISSLFDQGRIAGAVFSGLFFISYFMTIIVSIIRFEARPTQSPLLDNAFYLSLDGILQGLFKIILGTSGSRPFGMRTRGFEFPPPPNPALFITLYVLICAGFIWLAWRRVRAVEVVGS